MDNVTDKELDFLRLWARYILRVSRSIKRNRDFSAGYLAALQDVAKKVFGDTFLNDLLNSSETGDD